MSYVPTSTPRMASPFPRLNMYDRLVPRLRIESGATRRFQIDVHITCMCTSGRRSASRILPDKIRHSPQAFLTESSQRQSLPPSLPLLVVASEPLAERLARRDGCCGTTVRRPLRHFQRILRQKDRPSLHLDRISPREQAVQARLDGMLTLNSPHYKPRIRITEQDRTAAWLSLRPVERRTERGTDS